MLMSEGIPFIHHYLSHPTAAKGPFLTISCGPVRGCFIRNIFGFSEYIYFGFSVYTYIYKNSQNCFKGVTEDCKEKTQSIKDWPSVI